MPSTKTRALTGAKLWGHKPAKSRGGVSLRTPRSPVLFSLMPGNIMRLGCPACKTILYQGHGSPHDATQKYIERHVRLCQERQRLVSFLNYQARTV